MSSILRVAVLVTCHNRKNLTVNNLSLLHDFLNNIENIDLNIFLVDDGSSDGTYEAVAELSKNINIKRGNGSLFWAGGMRTAYESARAHGSFDAYLLFNDDVTVEKEAVENFIQEYLQVNLHQPSILAASTLGATGRVTYSAFLRDSFWSPLRIVRVEPNGLVQLCDTFNGNFVLIPGAFFESIGGLDSAYAHAYADIDIGYTANALGIKSYLASRSIGFCSENFINNNNSRILKIISGQWGKKDSLNQRLHFIFKHNPIYISILIAPLTSARYLMHRLFGFWGLLINFIQSIYFYLINPLCRFF